MELPKITKKIEKEAVQAYEDFKKNESLKESLSDEDARKEALAEYLGIDTSEVENSYDNVFEADGEEWAVLTEDEAREMAMESIVNIFDDLGLEAFTPSFQEQIINNYVETDAIEDMMLEDYRGYVEDIEYENDYTYGNRCIQEMYDEGILTDDDFEVDEDGEILYDTLKDDVDLEAKKEEYAQHLADGNDPISWLHEIYSDKELGDFLVREGLIDIDRVAEECIEMDGIAHFIASYDGEEVDLGDFYGYRLN